ncbi:hypothetical protein GS913_06445 [Rhodococcus hoagii]|nr:hypothetical protein [Prescottella equi]
MTIEWSPPKHAVYDDVPSIGLFTCVCGRSYATAAELYRHASTGTAQTRSPARFKIRKMPGGAWPGYWHLFDSGRLIAVSQEWGLLMRGVDQLSRWSPDVTVWEGEVR